MCKVVEKKNKVENEKEMADEDKILLNTRLEEKDNKIHQLSLHQAEMIYQINSANQEVVNLRIENDRPQNDLRVEKETNERMKSTRNHESVG